MISNGNRTEWSPIRTVIIQVINKIGRPRSGSPICLITSSSEKKSHLSARVMARNVQLLRHDVYCPIKVEIRAVDSQSDLRILL